MGLTFSGDLGLFLDSLDKILTELADPASEDLVSTIVVPQLREAFKTKTCHLLAVDIDIFDRAAIAVPERSIEFFFRCARQCLARIDRETMRTSLTKVSAVALYVQGGMQRRRRLAMPGSAGSASLVTSVVSNAIQRVLRSPVVLTKKAKAAKTRGQWKERKRESAWWMEVTCRSASDT